MSYKRNIRTDHAQSIFHFAERSHYLFRRRETVVFQLDRQLPTFIDSNKDKLFDLPFQFVEELIEVVVKDESVASKESVHDNKEM